MGNLTKGIIGAAEIAAGIAIPGAQFLIPMGAGMIAGGVAGLLTQPAERSRNNKDLGANLCDPTTSLPIVYGKARLGIARAFLQSAQYQTTNNYHLWIVGALCHGPVNGIDEIYLDGNLAFDRQGVVTSSPDAPATNYLGNVAVWRAYGTDGQKTVEPRTAVSSAFSGDVTGTAKAGANTLRITFGANHPFVPGDVVFLTSVGIQDDGDYPVTAIPSATQIEIDTGPDYVPGAGGAGGTVDYYTPDLTAVFPGQWTPVHNGRGVAWVIVRLNYSTTIFPNGVPKIECVVRGKPLHDPRGPVTLTIQQVYETAALGPYNSTTAVKTTTPHGLSVGQIINVSNCYNPGLDGYQRVGAIIDSTDFTVYKEYTTDYGSPAGTIDALSTANGFDPSAPNPNANPALAVRDYLLDTRYGVATPIGEINDQAFAGEASYCDQFVNTPWVDRGDLTAATFYIWSTAPNTSNSNYTDVTLMEQVDGQLTVGDIVAFQGAADPDLSNNVAIITAVSYSSFTCNVKSTKAQSSTEGTVAVICPASKCFNYSAIVSTTPVRGNEGSILGQTQVTVSSAAGFQVGQTVCCQGMEVGSDSYALKGMQGIVAISGNVLTLGHTSTGTDTSGAGVVVGCTPVGNQPAENYIIGTAPSGSWTYVTLSQPIGTYVVGSTVCIEGALATALNGTWPIVGVTGATISVAVDTSAVGSQSQGGTGQQMIASAQYQVNGALDSAQEIKNNIEKILASYRATLVYQGGQYRTWTRRVVTPTGYVLDESNIIGDWDLVTPDAKTMANVVKIFFSQNKRKSYQSDFAAWPDPNDLAYVNQFYLDDNSQYLRRTYELPLCNDFWQAQTIAQILRRESRTGIVGAVTCTEAALQLAYGDVVAITHATPGWVAQDVWVQDIQMNPDHTVRLTFLFYDPTAYALEAFSDAPLPNETSLPNSVFCNPPSALTITNEPGYLALIVSWTASPDADVDHYEIQWKLSSASVWLQAPNTPADATSVSLTIPDLSVSYDVQVRAVNIYAVPSIWVQDLGSNPSGGGPNVPIPCPTISVVVEAENDTGWVGPVGIVEWVEPTSAFFDHMEFAVAATGITTAYVDTKAPAPYRLHLSPNMSYTVTPYTATTSGVRTAGTPIIVSTMGNPSFENTVILQQSAGAGGPDSKITMGSFDVLPAGATPTSYSTWTGTNPNAIQGSYVSGSWQKSAAPAIITLTTHPIAANGLYVLTYDLASSNQQASASGNIQMAVDYSIDGGPWTLAGYTTIEACPYSVIGGTLTVDLGGLLSGATTVAFQLYALVQVTGGSPIGQASWTATVTGVSVAWDYATSTSVARQGFQIVPDVNQPHLTLLPNTSPPVATNAVAGEVTVASLNTGTLNVLQMHDGNAIATFGRYETQYVATDTLISAGTLTAVAGTGINVGAGESWVIEIEGYYTQSAASEGIYIDLSGTATFTTHTGTGYQTTGSGAAAAMQTSPFGAWNASTVAGGIVHQRHFVVVSAAGTIAIGCNYQLSADKPTLKAGSYIRAYRVA